MRLFLLSLLGLATGCASHPKTTQTFHAPSVAGVAAPVQRARVEVTTAASDLEKLAPHVTESGRSQLAALRESLRSAKIASEDAQNGLLAYATQVDAQTRQLNSAIDDRNTAVANAEEWHAQASNNARERDVVLLLFAGVAAFWIGTMFAGEILRNFPAPWSFLCAGGLYLGVGIAAYSSGRLHLHAASRLIP